MNTETTTVADLHKGDIIVTRRQETAKVCSLIKLPSGKVGVWVLGMTSLWSRVTPWCFGYLRTDTAVQRVVA
jgi:hypothetical protein